VPSPPASAIASFYAGGAFRTFITNASSGCASYDIDGFAAPLGIAEKRNDGSCAIVQPSKQHTDYQQLRACQLRHDHHNGSQRRVRHFRIIGQQCENDQRDQRHIQLPLQ
jgi:hypothetical protein